MPASFWNGAERNPSREITTINRHAAIVARSPRRARDACCGMSADDATGGEMSAASSEDSAVMLLLLHKLGAGARNPQALATGTVLLAVSAHRMLRRRCHPAQ